MLKRLIELLLKLFSKPQSTQQEKKPRLKTSVNCLEIIKYFEGVRLEAYKDVAGVWTIGYGDTGPGVVQGLKITMSEAEERLMNRLAYEFEPGVIKALDVEVTQGQLDALVSFAYNLGVSAFAGSTLCKLINLGNFIDAAGQFGRWINAGGKPYLGLKRRRAAEKALFEGKDWQKALEIAQSIERL